MSCWTDIYYEMIDACILSERLSAWETGFVESIRIRLKRQRPLSAKQTDTLDNIWQKVTKRKM